jgi:lipopolysaccharide transport protein LptA
MARSLLSNARSLGLAVAVGFAAGAQNDAVEELVLDSQSLAFDGQAKLFELHEPQITQGNLHIEADDALATGIDFNAKSEWTFTKNVRITIDTTEIEAESAVFTFEQKRLSRGELTGTPVSFTEVDAVRQTTVTGEAQQMTYDSIRKTFRLTGTARMQKDNVEFQGCDLIYDSAAERVTSGSADCADRFRVRVLRDDQPSSPDPPQ